MTTLSGGGHPNAPPQQTVNSFKRQMNETDSYLSSSSSSGDEGEGGNHDESLSSSESAMETSGVQRHPQFNGHGVP
jgi:hypothetical protein